VHTIISFVEIKTFAAIRPFGCFDRGSKVCRTDTYGDRPSMKILEDKSRSPKLPIVAQM
jgi:5'-3' exonuclease